MSKAAILLACERLGSQHALAKAVGLRSQGAVQRWLRSGKVPAEHVLNIERVSGISRHDLRPDIYPPPADRIITATEIAIRNAEQSAA